MQTENNSQEDPLIKKLITKWFWLYFFWYLSAPLWYIIRLIISNSPEVSPYDVWILYSIISLITILYTYNDLWLTGSLQHFLPIFKVHKKYDDIKFTIYLCLFIQILTWFLISIWLRYGSNRLAIHYFHDEWTSKLLKYFCFYFMWTNILQVIQSIFKSLQKTFEYKVTEFIKIFSMTLFSIFFLLIDLWNIEYYTIARLLWLFIAVIVWIILYLRYHKCLMQWKFKWDSTLFKKYTQYAVRSFIWSNIINISWQIILQMVLYFLWPESAWYYSNFQSLFNISTTLLWPIMFLVCPLTSELFEDSNKKKIQQLLSIFYNYFTIIVLWLSIIFISLWKEIAIVLYWEEYITSWILLSMTWFLLIFNQLSTFNYSFLSWIWKVKDKVIIIGVICILTAFISYIFINIWWIYWAGISFCLSVICSRLLSLLIINKHIKFKFDINLFLKNIIISCILWLIIYFTKNWIINKYIPWLNRIYLWIYILFIAFLVYIIIASANKNAIIRLLKQDKF